MGLRDFGDIFALVNLIGYVHFTSRKQKRPRFSTIFGFKDLPGFQNLEGLTGTSHFFTDFQVDGKR